MALPLYLAMTEGEIAAAPLSAGVAYMACHFAPYGNALTDIPQALPKGSLLILDDRIPVWGHDPDAVTAQLYETVTNFGCSGCLLDFQRAGVSLIKEITKCIADALPCPVAVTEAYAEGSNCCVLVGAPLPNLPLQEKAQLWKGRQLWLEAALETVRYTVTEDSSHRENVAQPSKPFCQHDEALCCSYQVEVLQDRAIFTVSRTWEDLQKLMEQAERMGFSRGVGLYQQLGGCE